MEERNYYLGFSVFPGIGPKKFEKLLIKFGSAKNAWDGSKEELEQIIGKALMPKFENFRNKFDIKKYEIELEKRKISYVCLEDKEYPTRLKKISNPPIILFVKGLINFNSQAKFIAIVGTRKITSYGKSITDLFSSHLSQSGLIIVSGLAIGVDAKAHTSCLESGGKTIAVMGNGVDICFPRSNQKIYDEILKRKGTLVSEFPPGEPPSAGSFPSRNRIIAGLSDGVLVTEGASDSGSLITANYGLEFGRKVFAVPGPITSSLSAAPLRLIEKGAKLVVGPEDVLKEFEIKPPSKKLVSARGDTKEEQKIIDLLQNESLNFDELVRNLKLDSSTVATILSMMEMKGIIKQPTGGNFLLNN